jgi:hypothetical protein
MMAISACGPESGWWNWLKAAPDEIGKEQVTAFFTGLEDSGIEEQQVRLYGKHDNLFESLLRGGNGEFVIGDDLPSSTEVINEEIGASFVRYIAPKARAE